MADHLNGSGAHHGVNDASDSMLSALNHFMVDGRSTTHARARRESTVSKLSPGKHAIRATGRDAVFSVRGRPDIIDRFGEAAAKRGLSKAEMFEKMVEAHDNLEDQP